MFISDAEFKRLYLNLKPSDRALFDAVLRAMASKVPVAAAASDRGARGSTRAKRRAER